ncbi:MAG: translation initiation factor eIF-2B [Candidatus Thorarchaeota archaeon]
MKNSFPETAEFKALKDTMARIKNLTIQGATNVAIYGVQAFARHASTVPLDGKELFDHLESVIQYLGSVRVTEPGLKNGLRYVMTGVYTDGKDEAIEYGEHYIGLIESAKQKIFKFGAERIRDNSVVFTHCHSSITVGIFLEAANQGKDFEVITTETRPLFQGRKTARILLQNNIHVTHIVDSAMRWAMNRYNPHMVFLGADAITVEGVALNKIGSRLCSLAAREEHIPLYICTSLLKYDQTTSIGRLSEIEMRSPFEIWKDDAPAGIKIKNPAFETIDRGHIAAYMTEVGLIPPQTVSLIFDQIYGDKIKDYEHLIHPN